MIELQLTKAQRRKICGGVPIDGFTVIDTYGVDLGPDEHGQRIYIAVIKRESDGQLYGVPWACGIKGFHIGHYSKKQINEMLPIVPLCTKTITVYESVSQSPLNELDLQL